LIELIITNAPGVYPTNLIAILLVGQISFYQDLVDLSFCLLSRFNKQLYCVHYT